MPTDQTEVRMILRTLYITREMDERLRDAAFAMRISKNEFIRQHIERALAEVAPTNGKRIPRAAMAVNGNGKRTAVTPTDTTRANGTRARTQPRPAAEKLR